jgi:hypothetical protein
MVRHFSLYCQAKTYHFALHFVFIKCSRFSEVVKSCPRHYPGKSSKDFPLVALKILSAFNGFSGKGAAAD